MQNLARNMGLDMAIPMALFITSVIAISFPISFGVVANIIITGEVSNNNTLYSETEKGNSITKLGGIVSLLSWASSIGLYFAIDLVATPTVLDAFLALFVDGFVFLGVCALISCIIMLGTMYVGCRTLRLAYQICTNPKYIKSWYNQGVELVDGSANDLKLLFQRIQD